MGLAENGKDQLGQQNVKCRSSSESARKLKYFEHSSTTKTQIDRTHLETESREGRMLRRARRERKLLQMLNDVISKTMGKLPWLS